jgi:threonyl-tRNA synthetase
MDTRTEQIRHSAAHVLAMATVRLFPNAKIGIGPVTSEGYHYDFEFQNPITPNDLKRIEEEMNLIIQENLPFTQIVVPRDQAFDLLISRGQIYKAELLRDIPDEEVSFYKTGDEFIDLCRGPHVKSTSEIGIIKLVDLSTAHWRNDERRPELQRISGVTYASLEELSAFLQRQQSIKNRDFRQLAKTLTLTLGGNSNVMYTPGGTMAFNAIQDVITAPYVKAGFRPIITSPITELKQAKIGIDHYYAHKNRSYKELPINLFSVSRQELTEPLSIAGKELYSATTHTYNQYFTGDEVLAQLRTAIDCILEIFQNLKLSVTAEIQTPSLEHAEMQYISEVLQRHGISQTQVVDENTHKVVVYFVAKDSLGRNWNILTYEYGISEDLHFVSKVGEITPVHTTTHTWIIDELFAYFIEDEEGLLPLWLAPIQAVIIPITEAQHEYAGLLGEYLEEEGFRVNVDRRAETMQAKIRDAEITKVPIIMVIGEKEATHESVSLRLRNQKEIGMVGQDILVQTIHQLYR